MTVDSGSRQEIERVTARVLRDAGITGPPVRIQDLLEHIKVHRDFYTLKDPKLIHRLKHKVRVQGERLLHVIKKVRLEALWLPDEKRILIEDALPAPKKEWASFHDATHSILEWHRPFFLGDTAQTLDPDFQEMLENEANVGASALMFCGSVFTRDALDTAPEWSSVDALSKRYGKSLVTTLRRYVENGHDLPMIMVISTPWWKRKPSDQATRCRHFVVSPSFARAFDTTVCGALLAEIDGNTQMRRGGVVGDFLVGLLDKNAQLHEFRGESFFNSHYLLTLLVHRKRLSGKSFSAPQSGRMRVS